MLRASSVARMAITSIRAALPRGAALLALAAALACRGGAAASPRAALDRFFETAHRQDYAATYDCYDAAYREKVSRAEYVRHRKEASPLESWRVLSLDEKEERAHAVVALVFGPSSKAGRTGSVSTTVEEDLVRERGAWRIRVW